MQRSLDITIGKRVSNLLSSRRFRTVSVVGLVLLGIVLTILSFLVFSSIVFEASPEVIRSVALANLVYIITVAGLIAGRVARIIQGRRRRASGSRLHMNLTRVFVLVALVPTVVVAIFATISLNFGLEGWFSDRVRQVLALFTLVSLSRGQ